MSPAPIRDAAVARVVNRSGNSSGGHREASLAIAGVHCAACVATIERRVRSLPGVVDIDVRVTDGRARVTWEGARATLDDIVATIASAGYRASIAGPVDEPARRRETRRALFGLFVAGFAMMQVMMYAFPAYVTDDGIAPDQERLLRWASLVLTLPVICYSALPFFEGACRDLRNRALGMDVPVALGIATAFAASAWSTWAGHGEVYFDSVTMFVFLLLGSRYLELRARQKASCAADALLRLQPDVAIRLATVRSCDANGHESKADAKAAREIVPVSSLAKGDRIAIRAGQIVPIDARVANGCATLSESLLTGESAPVLKQSGMPVLAGSTLYCTDSGDDLVAIVETAHDQTRLAEMMRLLDRALSEKPRLSRVADRLAAWFTGCLLLLAAATAAGWWLVDPARIIAVTVAVLVVSCPCALSLATPSVMAALTGVLARRGLLVLHAGALETLARATHIVFDKTGTLTSGEMTLQSVTPLSGSSDAACRDIASALEAGSQHPAGLALRRAAPLARPSVDVVRSPGFGVEGTVDGRRYRLGLPGFVAALHGHPVARACADAQPDETLIALGDERGWIASFVVADSMRSGARDLVRNLQRLGIAVSMLSGDRPDTAAHWSAQLEIDDAEGGATPARKREVIEALQRDGEIVVMIGDGANDMEALGIAHTSIAIGSGARLADAEHSSADMVWLGSDLRQLDWAIAKARQGMRIIRQNLAWAFVYNLTAIPLAVAGLIAPWQAGLGMSLSSLLVVVNALRVLREQPERSVEQFPNFPRWKFSTC